MQIQKIIILLLLLTTSYAHAAEAHQSEWLSGHVSDIKRDRDSVLIQIQFELDHQLLSNELMEITPVLSGENRRCVLPSLILAGKKQYKLLERNISFLSPIDQAGYYQQVAALRLVRNNPAKEFYHITLPFEKWMIGAELSYSYQSCDCCRKFVSRSSTEGRQISLKKHILPDLEPKKMPDIIKQASETLATKPDTLSMIFTREFKYRKSAHSLDLSFSQNKKAWDSLQDLLDTLSTKKAVITGISIKSYASPEGIYKFNEELSDSRAKDFLKIFQWAFGLDDQIVQVNSLGEDWSGLIDLLAKDSSQYKDKAISIIRNTGIFSGRERKLMDLNAGKPYLQMKEHMFPQLRRVGIEIHYQITNVKQ